MLEQLRLTTPPGRPLSRLGDEWVRPRPASDALRADLLVGAVLALVAALGFELARSGGLFEDTRRPTAELLAWTVAIALPLAARRRYPVAVALVSAVLFLGAGLRDQAVAVQLTVQVYFFAALYSACAWGPDRRRTRVALAVVLLVMFGWVAVILATGAGISGSINDVEAAGWLPPPLALGLYTVGVNLVYFAGAMLIGQAAWSSARQREELRVQASELAQQAVTIARRAVLDERVRIARELHDVVAHHVAVMGVQAGAARRVLDRDPDAARTALAAVEDSSRRAVAEMRSLLGVLRSGEDPGRPQDDDRAPQPGLERLPDLVREVGEQGLDAELVVVGTPFEVPSTSSLSLYRTVQEALANVALHSTARSAQVTVRYHGGDARAVEVEVLDAGSPSRRVGGTGLGHVGMRERAALHFGEVEIGRRPFGGFRVRVRYPVDARLDAAPARSR